MLPNLDFLITAQSNENDIHVVTYIDDMNNKDQLLGAK